jgi:predicted AAA+ superfamily ATPase
MKRKLYNNLLKWKDSASRKPLMLYGARQVGKTYLLQEFGKKEYENLVYINCYKNETIKQLYNLDKDTNRLLRGLSAFSNQSIYPGKTLIFLDEVQEIPAAVSALKYFAEDAPDYHIVVAGSLLGVMNMQGESFPVGKIDILHLRPMDLPEFLMALGEKALSKLIDEHDLNMMDIMS